MKLQITGSVKKICIFITALCLIAATGIGTCAATEEIDVIVEFNTGVDISTTLLESNHSNVSHRYNAINAVAMTVSIEEYNKLKNDSSVAHIEEDKTVHILGELQSSGWYFHEHESLAWHVSRVGADRVWGPGNEHNVTQGENAGDGIKVAILDTGVDYDHQDLEENIADFVSFTPNQDPDDVYGHGTHVIGIVACVDNDIGFIGVAPHVQVYSVKVISNSGFGSQSDILAGLDWAIENDMDVISMSFGNRVGSTQVSKILKIAYDNGIVLVAAAGNNGLTVEYPAADGSVIAVAATNAMDVRSVYSSRGPEVELCAPGDYILSTYKDGGYAMFAGTSMAAPQVAATIALMLNTEINLDYDANNNNKWDPAEVRHRLACTATDLGEPGRDEKYGYGLVNAYEATRHTNEPPIADWNPWDDDLEITSIEISMAEWHWATNTPINKHLLSNRDILLLEYQWVTDDFS